MRKATVLTFLIILFVTGLTVPMDVFGQGGEILEIGSLQPGEGVAEGDISEYIKRFYNTALGLAGIAAVLMIVIGAVYLTISGGSPDKRSEGRKYITSAIWGVVILLGAVVILNTVNPRIARLSEPSAEPLCDDEGNPPPGASDCIERPGGEELAIGNCEQKMAICRGIYTDDLWMVIPSGNARVPVFDCRTGCTEEIEIEWETVASGSTIIAHVWHVRGSTDMAQCAVDTYIEPGETATQPLGRTDNLELCF